MEKEKDIKLLAEDEEDKGYKYYELGNEAYDKNELDKAKEYYELAYQNGFLDAHLYLGIILVESDDLASQEKGFNYFLEGIDNGLPYAFYLVSQCYMEGIGTKKDEEKGLKELELAASFDIADALIDLGKYYLEKKEHNEETVNQAIEFFLRAEKLHSEGAAYNLGIVYQYHVGDSNLAIKHYKKAIKGGFYEAYWQIASIYYEGKLVPQDYKRAYRYFLLGAKYGDDSSIASLGIMYYHGQGVKTNKEKAISCFKKVAETNGVACVNLAYCYLTGDGVRKNYKKAYDLYLTVADKRSEAAYNLALMALKGLGYKKDITKALMFYELACEIGSVDAMFDLAELYDKGEVVPQDLTLAFKYYKMAADCGDNHAKCNLGICYLLGQGCQVDYKEALKYLEEAAAAGIGMASLQLGNMYYYGEGVDTDYEMGVAYFMKALEQNCLIANNNLGLAYTDGKCFPPDYQKAISYFNQAIAAKVYQAYYNLGLMYLQGKGVQKDYKKAVELFKVAANNGVKEALTAIMLAVKEYEENKKNVS